MKTLSGAVVSPRELTPAQLDRLFGLMDATYGGCTKKKFLRDMHNKDYVLLLCNTQRCIQGFTTLEVFDFAHERQTFKIIFSGDTVIAAEARGSLTLMREWWRVVSDIRAQSPGEEFYWLLISKGWRTYKMCPLFFKEFYPHRSLVTPQPMHRLMEALGRVRFGAQYQNGLIIPDDPDFLRNGVNDVPQRKGRDADVCFFLQQNPLFHVGNELVCLCRLHPDNMTDMALRHFHARLSHADVSL